MVRHFGSALFGICIALGFLSAGSAQGGANEGPSAIVWPQTHSDIAPDPDARFGRLPNGMTYVIYKNNTPAKNVSVRLRIAAGSMMEAQNECGVAHFIEHMAFNGSLHIPRGQLLPLLQRYGMKFGPDAQAITAPDKTVYMLDLPDNDAAALDAAVFVMREFAGNLLFQSDAVSHERDTILGEERLRNTSQQLAGSGWRIAAFAGQKFSAGGDAIGKADAIKAVTPQTLIAFYRAFYRPSLTTLVVAGDIDPDQIEAKIKAHFSDWQAAGPGRQVVFEPYRAKGLQTYVYSAPTVADTITVSWFLPFDGSAVTRAKNDAFLENIVLVSILNNRLQHQAQQNNAAYVGAGMATQPVFQTAKLLQLGIMPKPGQDRKAFEQAMRVYRQFARFGVTAEEVTPIIAGIESSLKNESIGAKTRNTAAIADRIILAIDGNDVFTSPAQDEADFARLKPSLTAENLNLRLKTLLTGDGPLLAHMAENTGDLDAGAMKAAYQTAMQASVSAYRVEAAVQWPYTDFGKAQLPMVKKDFKDLGFTRYSFANGLTLNVKPTKFKDSQILVSISFKGGLKALPPQTDAPIFVTKIYAGAGFFANGGLNKITLEQLNKALAGKKLSFAYTLNETEATLSGETTQADLPAQLQLFMAYATDAAYRPASFDQLHSALPMIYAQQVSNPLIMLQFHLAGLVHANDKRFAAPSLADASAVSNAQAQSLIRSTLENRPVEITIVGDVNPEAAVNGAAATFATLPVLPKDAPLAAGADRTAFPTENLLQTLHHNGRADQSLSMLAWPVPGETQDTQVSRGLEILTEILNLRAFNTIRQQLGQAYDANARRDQSWGFKAFGYIAVSGSIATGNDKSFAAAVNGIIDDLKTNPVSQDELDRARKPLLERWHNDQNDNQHWVYMLPHVDDRSTLANAVYKNRDELAKVTPAMIRDLAEKYLRTDLALHVEILPQDGSSQASR